MLLSLVNLKNELVISPFFFLLVLLLLFVFVFLPFLVFLSVCLFGHSSAYRNVGLCSKATVEGLATVEISYTEW